MRGRRPGRPETRVEVLEVARRRFLADGYQAVTMRSVAAEAGVDAALISYYFGSKKGLFGAALALSANPPEVLLGALAGDLETLPERALSDRCTPGTTPKAATPCAPWSARPSRNPIWHDCSERFSSTRSSTASPSTYRVDPRDFAQPPSSRSGRRRLRAVRARGGTGRNHEA